MAASPRASSAVPPSSNAVSPSSVASEPTGKASGPRMLAAAGLVLLVAWVVALLFGVGELAHVLLLVGLMLEMIAGLKARDATVRSALGHDPEKR